MTVRDPQRLLPRLVGFHFEQALFVPNQSKYNKLGSLASPPLEREQVDLPWQSSLQRVWESLPHSNEGLNGAKYSRTNSVFESLPLAIKWLRETAQQNPSTQFQIASRTTSLASDAATAKAHFRCATSPPWMGFFTARPILNNCSRRQAPSAKTSLEVRRQIMNRYRVLNSKAPNKLSSMFCGTQDKCVACKKMVYPLEKMTLESEPYHKTCFKCAHGGCLLTTASYAALNGILYCQHHFWQLFKETGSYNNLLKPALTKNAEETEAAEPAKADPEMEATKEEAPPEATYT
ncbi:LIM domain-containing protein WLIM1-like isoform X1 [Phragmites australis]|uniref:LIM domain-containing protein WLIM1-like isoform X1 n=1 Tax=Phragmites australis TaxID=29695 RepID=UPI002D79BE52|nr:LIM domain-containing protein WLIM1-like isoform X1 [Phragmites australis]